MGGHQARLAATLRKLHEVAGKPTLAEIVNYVQDKAGPISDTTISDWKTPGKRAPLRASTAQFMAVVDFLEKRATDKVRGRRRIPEGVWQGLLSNAQQESEAAQTKGRPTARRRVLPGSGLAAPFMLPADPPGFTGQESRIDELLSYLAPSPGQMGTVVSVITGMPGAGKTALAVHIGHHARAEDWFPGGIILMDLRGFSPDEQAEYGTTAARLLRVLGTKGADVPAAAQERVLAWRGLLDQLSQQHRALLVILDNVAEAAQVRKLLPGPPHRMIITSRNTLSALPAHQIEVDPLGADEAVHLLDTALRIGRSGDDRITSGPDDARHLAELCGYLPLALQIVAALLREEPDRPLADLARDLADARLERLHYDDTDDEGRPLAISAAFDLSYEHLTSAQQRGFRLLAVIPGADASTSAAAAVLGQPDAETRGLLAGLARAHLLSRNTFGRWTMHDLTRLYADDRGRQHADDDQQDHAIACLFGYYSGNVKAAAAWLRLAPAALERVKPGQFESREQAADWLDDERSGLVAAIRAAHDAGRWDQAHQLAVDLGGYFEFRHYTDDWITTSTLALEAADRLGPQARFDAAMTLGNAYRVAHQYEESLTYLRQALDLSQNDSMRSVALHNLGLTYFRKGSYPRAEMCHREDRRICTLRGDLRGAAQAGVALGDALRARERFPEAARALEEAIAIFQRLDKRGLGDPRGLMNARINLALTYLVSPRRNRTASYIIWQLCTALAIARNLDERHAQATIFTNLSTAYQNRCAACHLASALEWAQRSTALFRQLGDPSGEARALTALAMAQASAGDAALAREHLQQADAIYRELAASNDSKLVREILQELADQADTPEHLNCLDRRNENENEFLHDWLEDLPHAVLRGHDDRLTEVLFAAAGNTG